MATTVQVLEFDKLYSAAKSHEKSIQKIRTKIFNYVGFPRVSFDEDHRLFLRDHFSKLSEDVAAELLGKLNKRVTNVAVFNDKISVFCKLDDKQMTRVVNELDKKLASSQKNVYTDSFPDVPSVDSSISDDYVVFKRLKDQGGKVAIYLAGRKRRYQRTFDLPVDYVKDGAVGDEVTLIKASAKGLLSECSVDAFVVHADRGILEYRLSGAALLSIQIKSELFNKMNIFIRKLAGFNGFTHAINFFPAISNLYHEKDEECSVTKFGFLTHQGVGRQEKSSRDKVDIRGETYHQEGAKAIDHDFQAHGIRKKWARKDVSISNDLKLEIWASSRVFNKPNPTIENVYLLGSYQPDEYAFLIKKALEAL